MTITPDIGNRAVWDPTEIDEIPDKINDQTPQNFLLMLQFVKPLYCGIFILGMLSNTWMIYYLFKFSTLHISPKIYLVNRALVDFLYVLNLPHFMNMTNTIGWHFGNFGCKAHYGITFSQPISPAIFLVLNFLDFFVSHRFPQKAKKWRTPRNAIIVSIVIWILKVLYLLPVATQADLYTDFNGVKHCFMFLHNTSLFSDSTNLFLYGLVGGYIVPLLVVLVISLALRRTQNFSICGTEERKEEQHELQECGNARPNERPHEEFLITDSNKENRKSNYKVDCGSDSLGLKLAVVMSAILFVGYLPYWLSYIFLLLNNYNMSTKWKIAYEVFVLFRCLVHSIPAINPVVVILVSSNIHPRMFLRRTASYFERLLLCCREFKPLNRIAKRTRWSLMQRLNDRTNLDDVRTVGQ